MSSNPGSTDKKEQDHTLSSLNLIDFDAIPEPTPTAAVIQSQQIVPYSEGGNVSAPTSTNEMASNISKVNSMDFLLFELSSPSNAPSGGTSERPLEGASPSFINEGSLTLASTTNTSLDPNYVGTNASPVKDAPALPQVGSHAIVTVSQAQKLPAVYQNLSVPVPPGNGSSTYLQTSSGQSLDMKVHKCCNMFCSGIEKKLFEDSIVL